MMDRQEVKKLITQGGVVDYYGPIMSFKTASNWFDRLLEGITWEHDVANMFGRRIVTKRKVAWYGDEAFAYTYSKHTRLALP